MSDPAPRCSIVIRAFNEEHHIGRLLTGIYQQTVREIEVIVVDSGSTDATLAIAGEYPVKLLSIAPQDFTFGRSLNLGCENATGKLIVIASAHVYPVFPDWIERLIEPLADPSPRPAASSTSKGLATAVSSRPGRGSCCRGPANGSPRLR